MKLTIPDGVLLPGKHGNTDISGCKATILLENKEFWCVEILGKILIVKKSS